MIKILSVVVAFGVTLVGGYSQNIFTAFLNGPNEVPPNSSLSVGTGSFTLWGSNVCYSIGVYLAQGTALVDAGIFGPASPTQNGPMIFDLGTPVITPSGAGSFVSYGGAQALTPEQWSLLMADQWYINILTTGYPSGEIRGQVIQNGALMSGYLGWEPINETVSISGEIGIGFYFGPVGAVTIPSTIDGLPVTDVDFTEGGYNITSVTIPSSVTNITPRAFAEGSRLNAITVDTQNPFYTSVNGVLFDKNQTTLLVYPQGLSGSYTIPNSVTSLGGYAFYKCTGLTNVVIPNSITSIGAQAFAYCTNLTGVYFQGNAPSPSTNSSVFWGDNNAIVYYLAGTTGWGSTFDGRPTALWVLPKPRILESGPSFGVQTNSFGFIISWATNVPVVVEASTSLVAPTWSPISTNTLTSGWSYFSDPHWADYPGRFYRVRSP